MSTSGGRENHRNRRYATAASLVAALPALAFAAGFPEPSDAVSPQRPLKSTGPVAGDLPKPKLSKRASKWLKRAERIFEETGSYEKTAKRMDSRPAWIKADLNRYDYLKSMGPVETFTCSGSSE